MNWDFDSILEQSISQIAAGKARLESCLLAYPTLADELEPLLLTASTLQAVPVPSLSPAARARIETQVLAAALANPQLHPPTRRWAPVALPSWRWALNALAAAVVVVLLLATTLVPASANALPGSALYSVKLATEDAWLWVAPARSDPALHLRFARRRLAELEELATQGKFEPSILAALAEQVEATLDGLEDLPPAIALPLLDETARFMEEQQSSLAGMAELVPPGMRSILDIALDRSRTQAERIRALGRELRSVEPDASAATLEPVAPLAVTNTATPTLTVEPTLSPTIEPTGTGTTTPTLAPTGTGTTTPPPPAPTDGGSSGASTRPPASPPPAPTDPPPPASTDPPPPPTDPPPPASTDPPPAPTDPPATKHVPPGKTNTPQPPGRTKTPKPTNKNKP